MNIVDKVINPGITKVIKIFNQVSPDFAQMSDNKKQVVAKKMADNPAFLKQKLLQHDKLFRRLPMQEQHKVLNSLCEKGFMAKVGNALKVGTGKLMAFMGKDLGYGDPDSMTKKAGRVAKEMAKRSNNDQLKYTPSELNHNKVVRTAENFALGAIQEIPQQIAFAPITGLGTGMIMKGAGTVLSKTPMLASFAARTPGIIKGAAAGATAEWAFRGDHRAGC